MKSLTVFVVTALLAITAWPLIGRADSFDLRDVNGVDYVTAVKNQTSGTCWAHGTMAAIEGNLLMTGAWDRAGFSEPPNLAEYHLDWWNGFNQHQNDDITPPTGDGLEVHMGGDYRVVQAYVSRGEGAVYSELANDATERDRPWYNEPPARTDSDYAVFYVRDIEWYAIDPNLAGIDAIKDAIRTHGVLGTCMCWENVFYDSATRTHYQPEDDSLEPNHSIAIVGWDDEKKTRARLPGAWLCKNSWGSGWGDGGYFWISYYDKHCCRHPEMGAVSFQNAEPLAYSNVYYHDFHGWRDTKTDCREAFNAFVADANEIISAVSFVAAVDNVTYTVAVFDRFEDGRLLGELTSQSGDIERTGFHTIDLDVPVEVSAGDDFYVYLDLSDGGQAFDRTSEIEVLLMDSTPPVSAVSAQAGAEGEFWTAFKGALAGAGTMVKSSGRPGQSYYYDGAAWVDLHDVDETANFCIKALAVDEHVMALNVVKKVSPRQYRAYQVEIQNMGLGLYGGPAYDQGYRNRDSGIFFGDTLGNQETRLYLVDQFSSMGLDVAVQGFFKNVVAELPGIRTPEDIYIVSAHYDTTSNGERPGGDDNASGTAGVLEAARVLSQYRFNSTLRFIGFNTEEDWMLGSQDYVDRVVVANNENVLGVINLDMILRPGWDSDPQEPIDLDVVTGASPACSVWAYVFMDAVATYTPSLVIDPAAPDTADWTASDQGPFISAGYPALLIIENTAHEIWSGRSNVYYHGAEDASDALANDASSPSGVTYDYGFATDVVRATAATLALEAGLVPGQH